MQIMDEFTEYEKGLKLLNQYFDKEHPEILNFKSLESRLNENIRSARINGDNQNNKSDRNRILNQLNLLSLKFTQFSFNELCRQAISEEYPLKKPRKPDKETPEANPNEQNQQEYRTVIPIGVDLPIIEPPGHIILPPGYLYLGRLDGLDVDHFYREKDGHIVLYFPQIPGNTKPFLIDKYAITATQFCNCLNELLDKDIIKIEKYPTFSCIDKQERPIVFDALEQWRRGNTTRQPWLHAAKPWGISYQSGRWQPAPGSELLPVTNITWWGARLYSLWCHDRLEAKTREHTTYLPTVIQWQEAAQLEISGRRRRYPWGDTWRCEWVNHAGYWADREVREENWVENWATRENIYQNTRPLPVANINDGRSAIGCVQMLGNVWEWCSDNFTGESSLDKTVIGGACLSPQEYCSPGWKTKWRSGHGSEYIGFRCCFPLNK
ncbi:MAG: SUMF1/EgtB/PvdO family nonheme iron enzyme [Candidatus Aminicenantes bacterium]|nr:SUMF1/EgtB/PvdO family nonheme iron enzyme [Candidatus Aminicenantes bacterium]